MSLTTHVDSTIEAAIADKRIVGAVVLVRRDGEPVYEGVHGLIDREAGTPMRRDAIFRLASVTKPIVAATALAMVDKGLMRLDDPVSGYLPYFTPRLPDGGQAVITIRQLLTHTAGLGYAYPEYGATTGMPDTDLGFEENFSRVAKAPLLYAPGTQWLYSTAIDVLGAAIAARAGTSLEAAVEEHVTGPLGMADTAFRVTDPDRLAVPYGDGDPKPERMGEPHLMTNAQGATVGFSPRRIFNPRAFQSGGAGMAGTADDIMALLEAFRRGGAPILGEKITREAMSNQIGDLPRDEPGMRFGYLGAVAEDPAASGWSTAPGTVAWGGIYGHNWFIDPVNRLSVVVMTNTAFEGCNGRFRDEVREAVYAEADRRAAE